MDSEDVNQTDLNMNYYWKSNREKSSLIYPILHDIWNFLPFLKKTLFLLLQFSEFFLPIWSVPKTGSANCLFILHEWILFYTGELFSKRTQILFQYSEDDFETKENIVGMVDKWKQ